MKKTLMVCLLFGAVLMGCERKSEVNESEVQRLHDRMLVVHDSIMPLTGTLMSLKQKCQQQADASADSSEANTWFLKAKSLDNAYNEMMNWMHRYAVIKDTAGVAVLQMELRGIEAVAVHYGHSMADARQALQSLDSLK
ncbi:MAG: hypothetical protein O3C32_08535 [Bacteroidetes bacterium]|nr:hypothetical protein [Bacteroidota bacterium]